MAEQSPKELSMEEILASIRNILQETSGDNVPHRSEEDEEVFELSPAMMLDEKAEAEQNMVPLAEDSNEMFLTDFPDEVPANVLMSDSMAIVEKMPEPKAPEHHEPHPAPKAPEHHEPRPASKAPEHHEPHPAPKAPEHHEPHPAPKTPEHHEPHPAPKAPEHHEPHPAPKAPEHHESHPQPPMPPKHNLHPLTRPGQEVSENMIKSFAQLFEEQNPTAMVSVSREDAGRLLEEIVRNAVADKINDCLLNAAVKEKIVPVLDNWLKLYLPEIIHQEVERVMAKVGKR